MYFTDYARCVNMIWVDTNDIYYELVFVLGSGYHSMFKWCGRMNKMARWVPFSTLIQGQ